MAVIDPKHPDLRYEMEYAEIIAARAYGIDLEGYEPQFVYIGSFEPVCSDGDGTCITIDGNAAEVIKIGLTTREGGKGPVTIFDRSASEKLRKLLKERPKSAEELADVCRALEDASKLLENEGMSQDSILDAKKYIRDHLSAFTDMPPEDIADKMREWLAHRAQIRALFSE